MQHGNCGGQLLNGSMRSGYPGASDRVGAHDTSLKLGDLGKRGIDCVLDGANLRCDFECCVLDQLFAHDLLLSGKAASRFSGSTDQG
jgi:hypothetical protein